MAGWSMADPTVAGKAAEVWAAVGTSYFQVLTAHLSGVLGADVVYVGEVARGASERINILAASNSSLAAGSLTLPGTAAAEVLSRGAFTCQSGARQLFPLDSTLEKQGTEAYAGQALFDSSGRSLGIVAATWRHPLADFAPAVALLRAFAPRTAAELERKRADDILHESEQRYRAFIAANPESMWRVEFDEPIPIDLSEDEQIERMGRLGYIAEANEAAARMTGAPSAEDLIGKRLGEFAPLMHTEEENLRKVIRSGYKATIVNATPLGNGPDGRYLIRDYLGVVEKGALVRFWGITRDTGDLRRAELKAEASERRFQRILETILLAAVTLDREGRVTFCNEYLLRVLGRSREDLIGKNWFETVVFEEDRARLKEEFAKSIAGVEDSQSLETRLIGRDGACRLLEWERVTLRDAEGKVTGVAGLGRDITDQKALEARLSRAQKLESVGRLAGGIAHDFNNLLTVIRGYAGQLREAHHSGPLREAADEVIRAAGQGEELTKQLLAFSRNQPLAPRLLRLNDVVAENENILRQLTAGRVELVENLESSSRTVLADPVQMHQVLVNLALNAVDAMPDGGKLTITAKDVDVGETGAEGMPDVEPGRYVMLEVADTGSGMAEEVKEHLFEPFYTTKPGRGTGLGLASVYGIISQSGGHIFVDTERGKGTTFKILLPEAGQSGPGPGAGEPAAARRAAAGVILLVEDQQALRTLAARTLRTLGYEVLESASGQEALSIAESRTDPIDLLLADLTLPDMDGRQLAARLKARHPDLKILYTSGYTEKPPGEAYLQKPFTMRALGDKVGDLLRPGR
ncbi:MAG TPA: PAS domain S-box protein [Bryobacteraceae bacterium]|nr:PAS domain S-box protein [Bryobacteraceae bacterium]HOL70662.1 PAS domain S-box protein [Bryobacteraceae bacterium]HOQ44035.1 PAS domain S-box protein [Bryobacteraceae bacterium]HPU70353.1 PAS domain S-box protein [Bryobacteraceae bacterium]